MRATAEGYDLSTLPVGNAAEAHPPGQWGMLLLIATEAALFASLIFSYFYLSVRAPVWPPHDPPELTVATVNTFILLASSLTLHWGERGIRKGSVGRMKTGLLLTILLGAVFLGLQGFEYSRLGFAPWTDAYGSAFFTITGMHGTHVLVGLLILVFLSVMGLKGMLTQDDHHYLSNAALYWHFVDAVWLAVYTSLYLSPHFGF